MNETFRRLIESLQPKLDLLLSCPAVKASNLPPDIPKKGIYLFSEGSRHLYVGRSNRIRERLRSHTQQSGGSNAATLAFRIARVETGNTERSYKTKGSRTELERNPFFRRAFLSAKARLAKAEIRYVEENDPVRQAVLEIYAATCLKAEFNDFDNH